MGLRAFGGSLLLCLTALSACSGQTEVAPGIAHPAASASDGYPLAEGDELHAFNGMNLVLPDGWHARLSAACLTPPGEEARETAAPREHGCPRGAIGIRPDAARDGLTDPEGAGLDAEGGWRRPGTGCPSPGDGPPAPPVAAEPVDRDRFTVVSGERVETAEWRLTCADGARPSTRIWYVPEVDVEFGVAAMAEGISREEYERVVRSLDFSRYL